MVIMDIQDLRNYCESQADANPSCRKLIADVYYLAVDEIKEGSSESNEIELARTEIESICNKT